jgi:predicted DNA-binding transcriptional regulator YafY
MRASRLVTALLLLQSRGGMTAAELAAELEVSVRTIQRDMEELSAAGIPVYSERGRDGGYRLVDGYRSRLTGLEAGEAQALLAFGATSAAQQLGLGQALLSARLKLTAALPAALGQEVLAAGERFYLDAPGWFTAPDSVPHLPALAAAVFADEVLAARYRGRDTCLEPLGLVLKGGTWYLVARSGQGVRGYRAERFERVTPTGETFTRPDFDLAGFWTAWSREFERSLPLFPVRLQARPDCLPRLRGCLEPGRAAAVQWDAPADADGWVELTLPFEKMLFAFTALKGFGADVKVVDPPELRDQLIANAAAVTALYAS